LLKSAWLTIEKDFSNLLNHLKPLKTPLALYSLSFYLVLSILSNNRNQMTSFGEKTNDDNATSCSSLVLSSFFDTKTTIFEKIYKRT
jgi:hypothetical protein